MMKKQWVVLSVVLVLVAVLAACRKDTEIAEFSNTPYVLDLPLYFPPMDIPADNALTVEGIALGRELFYEKRLSADNSLACAGCHGAEHSYTDDDQFSLGIDDVAGDRNSMPIINLGYNNGFFWDGRAATLEEQILGPVPNVVEMHQSWPAAAEKLCNDPEYRSMFYAAFGSTKIDSTTVSKAIAQFLRTMVSGNSRYDKFVRGEVLLTPDELEGLNIFTTERGDCFHCHGGTFFSAQIYSNNGLDATFTDLGYGDVTGDANDNGKFKTPTLRNIEYTAPYMHDGRFATLEAVINHYSTGVVWSPTIDANMKKVDDGGLQLNPTEKAQLKAFLLTLSEPEFLTHPDYQDPNQ